MYARSKAIDTALIPSFSLARDVYMNIQFVVSFDNDVDGSAVAVTATFNVLNYAF